MNHFRAGYLIADVARLARQIFFHRRDNKLLTQAQARALGYISLHEGLRQVELAELMDIKPMSVMKTVDQLVEKDLIERQPDNLDRRAFLLFLRPDAHSQLTQIKHDSDTLWREVLNHIEPEKAEIFMQVLSEVRNNLSTIQHRQK